MPFWWPWRRSRPSSKRKDGGPVPASASASCSPRHSVDVVVPRAAYASASATPSAQWERAWTRSSLVSPAPAAPRGASDRAAAASATPCGGGPGPGGAAAGLGRGRGLPLPLPVYKSARGGSPVSSGSSSESDEVVDGTNYRYVDPFAYPGARTMPPDAHKCTTEEKHHLVSCSAPPTREHHKFFELPVTNAREVHLQSHEAANSGTTSRGRMFHKNTRARTRSLSPGPRGHDFASSFASPRDLGVSSRSMVKRTDDLKSQSQPFFASCLSQPLPRPPSHIASCPIPSSPTASAHSQSQWKKGKLLGSGTFGQVYLGFNSESGKFCAIKEVRVFFDDSKSKERLRQLNQEVDMLRQLSHQNIVQYYGSELTDEALSIYLEYVSGGSINKLLKDYGPFSEPVIRNYTRQILSGLAYLHGSKTVHRDIKGANVLVGSNGEVKLADFGMAKHITSLAEVHSVRGSPYWMAPEVIMNKNGYSFEVDIWSLGCTIIEMGTGRHPWHQYEDVPAMFKIVNTNDMPEIPERFSKEGKDFLSLCLKRDPSQRPSATQLLRHPFVQDNQAIRGAKSNTSLRNGLSLPAESSKKPSLKRSIAPLRDIGGIKARGFMGSSSACASPQKTSSRHIDVRANMSLPVSPCSSPLHQLKQSNWSCLASPSHLAFSSGSAAHNQRGSDPVLDLWRDPYGSLKRL